MKVPQLSRPSLLQIVIVDIFVTSRNKDGRDSWGTFIKFLWTTMGRKTLSDQQYIYVAFKALPTSSGQQCTGWCNPGAQPKRYM